MRTTTSRSPGLLSVLAKGGLIIAAAWLATRYFTERRAVTGEHWDWPRASDRAGQWDWPTASDAGDADRPA